MKKVTLFLLLFSITFLYAKKIEVCKNCEISTIKNALELAENGDEIFIRKGIYKENDIEVDKAVTILGEEGTVIDGDNKGSILHITSDNFVLKNIKIVNDETIEKEQEKKKTKKRPSKMKQGDC